MHEGCSGCGVKHVANGADLAVAGYRRCISAVSRSPAPTKRTARHVAPQRSPEAAAPGPACALSSVQAGKHFGVFVYSFPDEKFELVLLPGQHSTRRDMARDLQAHRGKRKKRLHGDRPRASDWDW